MSNTNLPDPDRYTNVLPNVKLPEDALERAITLAGSASQLARDLGCRHSSTIHNWQRRGLVPPRAALRIEMLTGGQCRAVDMVDPRLLVIPALLIAEMTAATETQPEE